MAGKDYKVEKKWFRLAFLLLPLASVINVLFGKIIRRYVNKKLANIKGFYGSVEKLHIGSRQIKVTNLILDKLDKNTGGRNKYISLQKLELSFKWKQLWSGLVLADVIIANPVFSHLTQVSPPDPATKPAKKNSNITHLNIFPFVVNKLEIKNGTVEYIDTTSSPIVRLDASNLYIRCSSISNIPEFGFPAQVMLLGKAYGGSLKVNAKVTLQKLKPAFDVNAEIENVELSRLNNFFDAYGKFTVNAGQLSLFTEVVANEGKFKGYVKPVITGIDIVGKNEEHQSAWRGIWESLVGTAVKLFENSKEDQLATKIPIEGKFSDAEVNVWYAIVETLRNAFICALTPSIDYTINFGSLKRKNNDAK